MLLLSLLALPLGFLAYHALRPEASHAALLTQDRMETLGRWGRAARAVARLADALSDGVSNATDVAARRILAVLEWAMRRPRAARD